MRRNCTKCTDIDQELIINSTSVFRHAVEPLKSLIKVEVGYACQRCGQKSTTEHIVTDNTEFPVRAADHSDTEAGEVRRHTAMLSNWSTDRKRFASVHFPAAFRLGENVLFPTSEGNLQDGTVIDQYGNPDLMLEFAEQYFELHRAIFPTKRLPSSLTELMPALHLLVIAAELVLKAYLIRDGNDKFGHSLQQLYKDLNPAQRNRIKLRYAESDSIKNLTTLGIEGPAVETVLGAYDHTYGGESKVYVDSRYYAEPTTRFKPLSSLHGANLVKSHNPYPIFLPEVVRAFIDTYGFFSGHKRIARLGGEVKYGAREPCNDNHGDWGFIPSSLNLVVVNVPQPAGISAEGDKLEAFNRLLTEHPPVFCADWMYGGNTLLFYGAGAQVSVDDHGTLNGVVCRLWYHKRIGMHARDLYLLANELERKTGFHILDGVQFERGSNALGDLR